MMPSRRRSLWALTD